MTRGRYAPCFWARRRPLLVAGWRGSVAPPDRSLVAVPLRPLLGLLAHEHAYVQAGQSVAARLMTGSTPRRRSGTRACGNLVAPAEGALGRLGRARLEGVAASGRAPLDARARRPASTASRPAACSPTSTRRRSRCASSRATRSIPGSRGRNCAKGPATLNQISDPDRILYPLRTGRRSRRRDAGSASPGTRRSTTSPAASGARSSEGGANEVMYHVGRPGEDGYTERVLAAWGVDGHNSHTNICSSSGRAGYHYWMGLDRPSPDHANAKVDPARQRPPRVGALLQPARPAHHRRQGTGRQADRARHAALEHGDARRLVGLARGRDRRRRSCSRSPAT